MTSTETQAAGPEFASRKPRMNHVAMSLSPEELDEAHRRLRAEFLSDVFGFYDLPMLTEDKHRQVFQVHNIEQFVFLIADDPPMTCPRMDHWGMSVKSEAQLDDYLERAKRFQQDDPRVVIVDKKTDEYEALSITAFYVKYLLPMTIEVQYWNFKQPAEAAS